MRRLVLLTALTVLHIFPAFARSDSKKILDSTYTFGAFDKLTGKRLAATFRIYFKNNEPIVIQGTTLSDVQFRPAVQGQYEIEISMRNYVTRRIPLNLENLGAGKTSFREVLEPASDEFIILITDAKDKQIITTAVVKIKDDKNKDAEAKINPKTGEWKAMLDLSKNYQVLIEAPGYISADLEISAVDITKNVKTPSKFISVSLLKNMSPMLSLMASDAITHEEIPASFKILRPEETTLTGQSTKDNPYRIEYNPKKKYTVEVNAEGYKTYTEQLAIAMPKNTDVATIPMRRFTLQKETYSFLFKIVDAQTRENIINTKMRIINLSNKQSIAAKIEKEGFSANLSAETEYSVEVESEGYVQANQNIDLKELIASRKFEHEILLNKKTIERYRLIVVDEETDKNVPGANLRVFNALNEPITIQTTAVQSEWQADLKIAEQYTAEVKLQGYLPYRSPLLKSNRTIYLKIRKTPLSDIYFMVTDFYTKNMLPAEYRLTTGNEAVNGSMNPEKTRFKASLTTDRNYEIEVRSPGYPPLRQVVNVTKAVNSVITLEIKKDGYSFIFNPLDAKTREPVLNAKISLVDNANQLLKVTGNTASLVSPESFGKKYSLRVQAANYKPFMEDINLMDMAVASFSRDVLLEKVEPVQPPLAENKPKPQEQTAVKQEQAVVKKEEKPTPPKEDKPVVQKEEKTTPPVVLPKEPEKAPVTAIANDYFRNVEVGKPVKLENVYFDQSQPAIKPQSYPELDKLAGLLKENPKVAIEIIGHTDNVGDPRMNLYLSELRARAVSNYLFNKGISPDRLSYTGKGQQQPVAANDTEENRQKNRRVEFIVLAN